MFIEFTLATWEQSRGTTISNASSLLAPWTSLASSIRQSSHTESLDGPVSSVCVLGGEEEAGVQPLRPGLCPLARCPRLGASACVSLSCCALAHVRPLARAQVGMCICSADVPPLGPLCPRRVIRSSWESASSGALTFCLLPTFSVIPEDLSKSRPCLLQERKTLPLVTFSQRAGTFPGNPSHYILLCWGFYL